MKKSNARAINASKSPTTKATKAAPRYWWLMAQGLCALVFGILAIFWPKLTLTLFLYVFGIYAIIEGLPPLGQAIFGGKQAQVRGRRSLLLEGLISVVAGVLCLVLPRAHERLLLYVVAAWLLLKGITYVMQTRSRGWQTSLLGVLAILIGIVVFFVVTISVHLVLLLVGIFALIMGALLFRRGWRARAAQHAQLGAAG